MANYANLLATIAANIYSNGNQEVTAAMVKSAVDAMVGSLGYGYQFRGAAAPSDNPGTPDQRVYYVAKSNGTYTNFGGISVSEDEVAILKWDSAWSKEVLTINAISTISPRLAQQDAEIASFEQTIRELVENYPNVTIYGNVTNNPDNEDINTNENNQLQFADRSTLNGMGYKILRRNKTFAEQVTDINTIYEIRYDFDLGGAYVTIPAGCVLKFNGGTIKNGRILLSDNDKLLGNLSNELDEVSVNIRGKNVAISGIMSTSSMARPAFEHSTIKDSPADFSGLLIENCNIIAKGDGTAYSGVALTFGVDYEEEMVVNNITIRNNTIQHGAMGVEFRNHFHSDPDDPYGTNTDELRLQGITIQNNHIENIVPATTYGFNISLSGRAKDAKVIGNTLIDGRLGIEVVGHFSNVDITNNVLRHTIARDSFTDCSGTSDEKSTGIRYIGNTFISKDNTSRNYANFKNIKEFEFADNYFTGGEIRLQGVENSDFHNNIVLAKAGYNILALEGCVKVRVENNFLSNDSNAYLFNFDIFNGVSPFENVIKGNTFTMGGNTYPPNRSTSYPNNLFFDNFDLRIGAIYKASGPSSNRPSVYLPVGYRYYNTDTKRLEYWTGNSSIGDNGWIDDNSTIQDWSPLPVTVPNSGSGGLLIVQDNSGAVSIFSVRYYVANATHPELTSNNRLVVTRLSAGGNITISGNSGITANIKYRFLKF